MADYGVTNQKEKKSCSKVAKFIGKMRIDLTMISKFMSFYFPTFSF